VISDTALIARVLAGDDRHAFSTLVRRHQGPLRAWLRKLLHHDSVLADDLAQETFIVAYRKLNQYRGEAEFRTWLLKIAYSALLMNQRKYRFEVNDPNALATGAEARTANPEDRTIDELDVEHAMRSLSPAEHAAIVQCYYFDLSHGEAAIALGCPVGTLKTYILRAKKKLHGILQRLPEEIPSA
jgi:RNA polymerase sigma factor (sigma-70 family)